MVSLDDLGIWVGQQRKIDLAAVREILKYFQAVVTDRRQLDTLALESLFRILQLDQLAFAVRSPVG